ncbi:MAG: 1-acyl-sn-glycerol-3-phosphate acyltransferase [Gammaproteobacteria bacterium]|nr:1-acyl-sn-glycerol-3-phosphate acyltransferase [Gammaproteobacteria bacterium]
MKLFRIPLRLFFLVLVVLLGLFMAVLFLRHSMSPGGFSALITRFWHSQVCRAFNIDVRVYGQQPADSMLIVSNHISWFDISAIGSVISARYLSKHEVVGWPVVGWLAKKAGTLFIQRGTKKSSEHSLEKMTTALTQGDHVVLFPEGKTTDGSVIRKLHARLFQSAINSRRKIQPVVIHYPHENGVHPKAPFINDITLYESAIGMLGEPHMSVEIHFLEAVDSDNKSRDELAKQCESLMQEKLTKIINKSNKETP